MIEFFGAINGKAEKYFYKKSREITIGVLLAGVVLLLPAISFLAWQLQYWQILFGYCAMLIIIPLLVCIPKSKKEKAAMIPRRIYIQDDVIVCIANRYTESKRINHVKCVRDHGEFYELVFPFGKISEKFICQKSLLTKGSIGQFERLFADKIQKM